jgi:hypothetical protein
MKASEFVMNEDQKEMQDLVYAYVSAHEDDDEPAELAILNAKNKLTGEMESLIFGIYYNDDDTSDVIPLAKVFENGRKVIEEYELAFEAEDDLSEGLTDFVPSPQLPKATKKKGFWEKLWGRS